jgi:DNA-binding NtrC family response regulator
MRPRVLIADPDELLLAAYRAFLTTEGIEAVTVTNGPDCLAALRESPPAVLILDPELPAGSDVLELLARGGDVPAVPVLIVTSNPARVTAAARPTDYALLIKPVAPALLARIVRTLMESRPVGV